MESNIQLSKAAQMTGCFLSLADNAIFCQSSIVASAGVRSVKYLVPTEQNALSHTKLLLLQKLLLFCTLGSSEVP